MTTFEVDEYRDHHAREIDHQRELRNAARERGTIARNNAALEHELSILKADHALLLKTLRDIIHAPGKGRGHAVTQMRAVKELIERETS